MIRFVLIIVFVVCFLILTLPVFFAEWLIGKWNPHLRDISSLRLVQWGFRVVGHLADVKLTVIGEENIPKDQPVLYIGNHRSFFDIVLTYPICPGLTGYIAKESMKKLPVISAWMKRLYCLFLNREDVREGLKVILTAIDQVKNGISIMIFPEGTRGRGASELDMLPFHEGSFKVAAKTGCPIVPVALVNTSAIFEDHFPYVRSAEVIIEYGKPIYMKELPREEQKLIGRSVQRVILEMLKKHRQG